DWINASYDDLRAAAHLLHDNTLNNATAFHCQQCVEKALKSFILYRTKQTVDGHNLTWLCRRAAGLDESFTQWIDESATLNRYYIETRYPTDIPTEITDETADCLYRLTEEMFYYVANEMNLTDQLDDLEAY
ncbi:MAG: HEPN domain-containing protein, partial [Oscillospiraceae bacterium]